MRMSKQIAIEYALLLASLAGAIGLVGYGAYDIVAYLISGEGR